MTEFTCDRCQEDRNGFWDSPPTCNRCLILAVIHSAIWTELAGNDSEIREYLTQTGWR